jgi:hypothetical protein
VYKQQYKQAVVYEQLYKEAVVHTCDKKMIVAINKLIIIFLFKLLIKKIITYLFFAVPLSGHLALACL